MKKFLIIGLFALGATACGNSAQTTVGTSAQNSNVNSASVQKTNETGTVSSHSTVRSSSTPPSSTAANTGNSASPSSAGNSPMAKAVDVGEMTANIEKADKAYQAKTGDAKLKNDLADAYFVRAFALTEAAQYRAALGDFRKGLKLNPEAKEARAMHDQIIDIFKSINRAPPKEGEEPPPMPFKKSS